MEARQDLAGSALSFDLGASGWDSTRAELVLGAEDAELVAGLRAGNDASYEQLIARFEHPIHNLIYRLLSDPGDAMDVVQEVFLKVFRSIGSFRGDSSLKTWVYRIAINEAHNHRRWFHRRRGHEIALEEEQADGRTYEQVLADTGRSPYELALSEQARAMLEEAVQHVKPLFREALFLRDIEGMTYEEIAGILQISLGTVKSRIVRGREALKAQLAGRMPPEWKCELAVQGAQP